MAIQPGTVIASRYRVVRQLGKGGMGEVFSAENTRTGRMVALKVLRAEAKAKQTAIERFRREARAAGAINSDFVTQVLDVDDDPEHGIVLVFELLEGESLVERLKRTGPVPFDELWGIVEAVWMGLADAHAAGIVHRDLKPSNVFLVERRSGMRVKILDFGISKLPKKISTQSLTQVGQSLGTFSFMPPEQIGKAKTVDHRADIYACATLIYQAMSGKLPYHAKNVVAMMDMKNKMEPRTLAEVMHGPVAPALEAFIAKGLARNPDHRFQSAQEALAVWRQLRPVGAVSVMDGDASAMPPVSDAPPSSEVHTEVMTLVRRPKSETEAVLPATVRDGSAAYQRAAEAMPPPQPAGAVLGTAVGLGATLPTAGTAPQPQIPLPAAAQYGASPHPAADAHRLMAYGKPPPRSGMRTAVALTVGALALMAVGFAAVAALMHYMR